MYLGEFPQPGNQQQHQSRALVDPGDPGVGLAGLANMLVSQTKVWRVNRMANCAQLTQRSPKLAA